MVKHVGWVYSGPIIWIEDRWLWVESYGEAHGVGLFGPHHLNHRCCTFTCRGPHELAWLEYFPFFLKVGRFEINLISPDTKSVVLEKNFKDISSCSQVMLSRHNTVFEGTNWRVPKLATQRRGFHISHLIIVKWSTCYFSLSLISPPFPSPETFLTHTVAPNLGEIMLYRTSVHVLGSVATDPSQDLTSVHHTAFSSALCLDDISWSPFCWREFCGGGFFWKYVTVSVPLTVSLWVLWVSPR